MSLFSKPVSLFLFCKFIWWHSIYCILFCLAVKPSNYSFANMVTTFITKKTFCCSKVSCVVCKYWHLIKEPCISQLLRGNRPLQDLSSIQQYAYLSWSQGSWSAGVALLHVSTSSWDPGAKGNMLFFFRRVEVQAIHMMPLKLELGLGTLLFAPTFY